MISVAVIKAFQVYGIAIAVSMLVAVLIKLMVMFMGRMERPAARPAPSAADVARVPAAASTGWPSWSRTRAKPRFSTEWKE